MITKILVPLDTSALAEQALPIAAAIAKSAGAELRLALVHEPIPYDGYPDAPWNGARVGMERTYLDSKCHELASQFGISVVTDHPTGPIATTICTLAANNHADLVVMTTHGRTGLSRAWLGSVADSIVRSLDVPVLMLRSAAGGAVAPPTQPLSLRRIMIPLDGSRRAECIVDTALALGGPKATYVLARIVPPVPMMLDADPYSMMATITDPDATDRLLDEARVYVKQIAARLTESGATSVEECVSVGEHAATKLLEFAKAKQVDAIAIATHGRGASRLVLGSVADKLLRGSCVPLLVCRDKQLTGAN